MKDVLLVDDSVTILMSMGDILRKLNLNVVTASHGKEALEKLKAGLKPALVITDYNMPIMNGVDFIRAAKQLPSMRFTPMLILTTESQTSTREEGRAAGAAAWLVKPISAADLTQVVKRVVPGL